MKSWYSEEKQKGFSERRSRLVTRVARAVLWGVVEDLGDVLVAVVGVKEIEAPVLGAHDERACGDGLGGIPHELGADGVRVGGVQSLDAEEVVVNKAEVRGDLTVSCLLIVHAATKAIEGHGNHGVALFQ